MWVQANSAETARRLIDRDGCSEEAARFQAEWTAEELPFYAHQRPWERADIIVAGTPTLPHNPHTEIVTATALKTRADS